MRPGGYGPAIDAATIFAEGAEFAWGRDDCLMWIANIDRAATGVDPAAPWRGRYRSERGAARVMGRRGIAGMMLRVARARGWRRVEPAEAVPGDRGLVLAALEGGGSVLVACIFDGLFWLSRVPYGYSGHPTGNVRRAWRPV